jgi:chorismate mutase/prephenate dehydrogenase
VRLVAERMAAAREIGAAKREAGVPLRDYEVERTVLDRAADTAEDLGLPAGAVRGLISGLITASRAEQERVSYSSFAGDAEHVAVVGGDGRMGRWFVDFLRNQGHRVTVVERDDDLVGGTQGTSITVLATPPEAMPAAVTTLADAGYDGVVCDIASLKSPLADAIAGAVGRGLAFTSIHPMFGPSARTLSDQVLCICDCGDAGATERIRGLFADTAVTIVPLDFEQHDRIVSYVLGFSHLVSLLFAKVLAAAGEGFADIDRVGSTTFHAQMSTTSAVISEDPDLYYTIQRLNPFTERLYETVRHEFEELASWVLDGDRDSFVAMMEGTRRWLAGR